MAGSTYLLGIAFDVRIRRVVVLAPVALLVFGGLLARMLRRGTPRGASLRPPRAGVLAARVAFGVSAFIAVGLFADALTRAYVGYDGEMTWCAAARWVRADRSVTPRALTDPRVFVWHPRYPLLLPLAQVAVQETFDLGDDRRAIRPLYAAFFPALLLVFFDVARRHAGTCAAALAATALAALPVLAFMDIGGADGAFSDVPLGAFFGSGFLLLLGRVRRSEAAAAAILLGAGVLTKNEGLPFALAALTAAGFFALFARRNERRRRFALLAVAAAGILAAGGALSVWKGRVPQRWDEDYLGRLGKVSLAANVRARVPLMPPALLREMTDRGNLAGFGLTGAVVAAAGVGGLRRRIVPPILLALYFCFGAYVLALLLTTWPGVQQLHPTWYRLLIQLSLPLGVLLALALRAAWRARFAVKRSALSGGTTLTRPLRQTKDARSSKKGIIAFVGLATLPAVAVWLWSLHLQQSAEKARALEASAAAANSTRSPWREDAALTGGVDEPAEGSTVQGELTVRGWARVPGQDLRVLVLIDDKERPSAASARSERRDVQRVIPTLGDCSCCWLRVHVRLFPRGHREARDPGSVPHARWPGAPLSGATVRLESTTRIPSATRRFSRPLLPGEFPRRVVAHAVDGAVEDDRKLVLALVAG